jgi:hypothetical protein
MNKIIGSLIALAVSMTGGYELLNTIQPHSETITVSQSINSTLDNAYALMQLNGTPLNIAVQQAVIENNKGVENGMISNSGYVIYTIGNTCMKGTINAGVNEITVC